MTIHRGTATLTGTSVSIAPPGGQFGQVDAVRLTNYTGEVLILQNIQGTGQGDEYLMPLQQMVYHTRNVSQIPTILGSLLGNAFVTSALFVEWSDDAVNDFIGEYPTAISAIAQASNPVPFLADVQQYPTHAATTTVLMTTYVSGNALTPIPKGQRLFISSFTLTGRNPTGGAIDVNVRGFTGSFGGNDSMSASLALPANGYGSVVVPISPAIVLVPTANSTFAVKDYSGIAGAIISMSATGGFLP